MISRVIAAAALAAAVAACSSLIPKSNEAIVPKTYDLGPARSATAAKPAIAATISIPAVSGPEWMDDGIVYRLLYDEPARMRTYTRSRWSSDPPSLLTDRVRSRFSSAARAVVSPIDNARSDYTLRIELHDFSHSLASPSQGNVTLRARVSLIASGDRSLVGQRELDVQRPAGASAEAAVKALTEATDAFLEELVKWVALELRPK